VDPKNEQKLAIESLINRVNEYLKEKSVHVRIMTPCYGGMTHVSYTQCLISTANLFNELKIELSIEMLGNESLITRGRNQLIATGMSNEKITHFMFIDSDITWDPLDILKLVISDKELVGGIYPFKNHYLERLQDPMFLKRVQTDHQQRHNKGVPLLRYIEHNLCNYNFVPVSDRMRVGDNLIETKRLATGFMMIKRSCIEKMIKAYPQTKYRTDSNYYLNGMSDTHNKYLYALFDSFVKGEQYLSEDWGFCDRWRDIGGQVYADVSIALGHSGNTTFNGRLLSIMSIA